MPTFISARVYARPAQCTDAARRCPPRHADHRRRAAQRRLLHPRAGFAAREEDGQPGRPDRLPPLLRRREGQRRLGHHLLRVPGRDPRQGGPRDGAHDRLAGRLRRGARLLGAAPGRPAANVDARRTTASSSRTPGGRPARAPRRRDDGRAARGEAARRSRRSTPSRASTASAPTRSTPTAARRCSRTRSASSGTATTPGRRAVTARRLVRLRHRRPRAAASPAPAPSTTSPGRRRSTSTTPGSSASPRRVTGRRR